jgi:hypothetical protein
MRQGKKRQKTIGNIRTIREITDLGKILAVTREAMYV